MKISVIIPALNEARCIGGAIKGACAADEVTVADGGSTDGTRSIAEGLRARVVLSTPGRGLQMQTAADLSSGDVLLFLHADTLLPPLWRKAVEDALKDDGVVGGGFRLSIGSAGARFRFIEAWANLRASIFGLIYGDQAIFVRKNAFASVGGFRKLPLMEDVDCVRRLRKSGRVVLLKERVATSPRRWERRGAVRNGLFNLTLLALYFLGVSPETLWKIYYGK